MKASKWLAWWNYVFYIRRNNWKNLGILAYIFINMQMFFCTSDRAWSENSRRLWPTLLQFQRHLTDSSVEAMFQPHQPTQTDEQSHQWNHLAWRLTRISTPFFDSRLKHLYNDSTVGVLYSRICDPCSSFQRPFFQPISDRLYLCLHAEGRVRGDRWDHIVSVDNLYLFFCPGWKICNESLGFLEVFCHLMLLVIGN